MRIKSLRTLFLANKEKLALGQVLVGELEDFSENIQTLLKENSYLFEILEDVPKKELVKVEPKPIVKVEPKKVIKKVVKPKKLVKKIKK